MPGEKHAWMMPGVLTLLAALIPDHHEIVLIDEAVEDIDFEALRRFDVIGITGQIAQRDRMIEILERVKTLPGTVVVGGPYAAIDEQFFDGLCDTIFVGEADQTWPEFVEAMANGDSVQSRYEQTEKTDMATLPPARMDLMKAEHYMSASIQYSRGCPFTCEFCDIIVIFGRRPRVKSAKQVIAELEGVWKAGFGVCFVVDDNFIGNKVAVKKMLPELIRWQEENGYPLVLSTEATLNLADDAELMELMIRANFREVFIGIESTREESLIETKKLQNIRGESMSTKLGRIRDAGLVVSAGFIVGFDEDDDRIFEEQVQFIESNNIGRVSFGVLVALPKTPLYERLEAEGRLTDDNDICNFIPKQMTRDQLVAGYEKALRRLYTAEAFIGRVVRNVTTSDKYIAKRREMQSRETRKPRWLGGVATSGVIAWRLGREMARRKVFRKGLRMYWRAYRRNRAAGGLSVSAFIGLCAMHWHHYCLTLLAAPGSGEQGLNIFSAASVDATKAADHMADA